MSITGKNRLDPTKAPTLPFAPVQYDRGYTDTKNNYLRQYFNTIDNATSQLFSNLGGGRFLTFPHIAAQDNTSQYTTDYTETKVMWDTLDSSIAFTLNPSGTASPTHTGIYKIDYSLQFANSDTQIHEVYVWLKVDDVNVAGSSSKFNVISSHGGVDGYLVAYSSITFEVTGGQSVALYWMTDKANDGASVDGVYMEAYPEQTFGTPPNEFTVPSTPSAIGSIVFVSGVP